MTVSQNGFLLYPRGGPRLVRRPAVIAARFVELGLTKLGGTGGWSIRLSLGSRVVRDAGSLETSDDIVKALDSSPDWGHGARSVAMVLDLSGDTRSYDIKRNKKITSGKRLTPCVFYNLCIYLPNTIQPARRLPIVHAKDLAVRTACPQRPQKPEKDQGPGRPMVHHHPVTNESFANVVFSARPMRLPCARCANKGCVVGPCQDLAIKPETA